MLNPGILDVGFTGLQPERGPGRVPDSWHVTPCSKQRNEASSPHREVLFSKIVELFNLLYATPRAERRLAAALLRGPSAWIFWSGLVLLVYGLVVLVVQAARDTWGVVPLVVAAVAISTSALVERYLTVIPSLTHGMMLPYEPGSYFPTWVEFAVVAGLFAFGALLVGIFMKLFPIIPFKRRTEQEVLADA